MRNQDKKMPNALTLTVIFEGDALNRDEKIGGNITSIKKLTRYDFNNRPKVFSYISRESIRHHLFTSLNRLYQHDWKEAPIFSSGKGENKVAQFNLKEANILNYAELDAFGYMYTMSGQNSIVRKAPVGITKAIALEPWEGDMQFNANHDLVARANLNRKDKENEITPDPVNGEEQKSYFKVSFTIDIDKLGEDIWTIDSYEYKDGNLELIKEIGKKAKGKDNFTTSIACSEDKEKKKYLIKNGSDDNDIDQLEIIDIDGKIKKVVFKLSEYNKRKRIKDIITAIKNGIVFHVSTENPGIVPKFIIASFIKLPIPIFHTYVDLNKLEKSILKNDYIDGEVYIENNLNFGDRKNKDFEDDRATPSWDKFLRQYNFSIKEDDKK